MSLNIEQARHWVRQRVSERRFQHITGVALTAQRLACQVGCDAQLAELAGWLHDACKEIRDYELVAQAKDYGLILHPIEEAHGHLLHGPVAAELVKREFSINNEELLGAIREHTLGEVEMTTLSKVVFLADALEPNRPQEYRLPILRALGLCDATSLEFASPEGPKEDLLSLNSAILKCCDLNLQDLIQKGRIIHPKTVAVRNYYLGPL